MDILFFFTVSAVPFLGKFFSCRLSLDHTGDHTDYTVHPFDEHEDEQRGSAHRDEYIVFLIFRHLCI